MKNKNDELRELKELGIREAIRHLHSMGSTKFTNLTIAEVSKELFDEGSRKQINSNTLSNSYYKNNLKRWIHEETGFPPLKEAREKSVEIRRKNAKANYRKIEKAVDELVDLILRGKIKCDKMTKSYVIEWIKNNKKSSGIKINAATFSLKYYVPIYNKILDRLHQGIVTNECVNPNGFISVREYAALKEEIIRLREMNKSLVSNLFVIGSENDQLLYREGDGNNYSSITLDKELLYEYLNNIENKLNPEINANQFFKSIIKVCGNE